MRWFFNGLHGHPFISEREKKEFLAWVGLSEERPAQFRQAVRAPCTRIRAEIAAEERRRSYIKCLAWYAGGRPVRESCYDWYEGDDWHVTSGDT